MSNKYAVVVLTDSETPADRGRMVHAMKLATELREAGDTVKLLLCGKGVTWAAFFSAERAKDEPHPYVKAYGKLFDDADVIACNMCARRFNVHEAISAANLTIEGEGKEHLRLGALVRDGYQVVTF